MWSLEDQSEKIIHIPLSKKEIQIGRNASSDLCLASDPSISRQHAKISVYKSSVSQNNSTCEITDHGSRFSTYILRKSEIKLTASVPFRLQPGDRIKFGGGKNIWTVNFTKLNILACGHCNDNKKNLVRVIEGIGGSIFSETSSECTHYISMCARITPKFIFAICHGLPITDKKYWEHFAIAVEKNIKLPNVNDYLITNTCLPAEFKDAPLYSTDDRRRIFSGLNFVFFSPSLCSNYGLAIKTAGGKSYLYHKFTFEIDDLLEPNMVVIECCQSERRKDLPLISDADYNSLQISLRKKNMRMINPKEILGAILFCSVKKYCNSMTKALNKFWLKSSEKKRKKAQKKIEKRAGLKENEVGDCSDLVSGSQKENRLVSAKAISTEINVPPRMLRNLLDVSGSETSDSEKSWLDTRPSQKTSQGTELASTSNVEKKGQTKDKEPILAVQSNENDKPLGVVSDDAAESSENIENIAEFIRKSANQPNKSVPESLNVSNNKKSSAKTILDVLRDSNKKSLKGSEDVGNLKRNLSIDNSVSEREKNEKKNSEVPGDFSRNSLNDCENEIFKKRHPNSQLQVEEILDNSEASEKVSKDKNVEESNNQPNMDAEKTSKDPIPSKGIKVVSNVEVKVKKNKFASILNISELKSSKINKKMEDSNKNHPDPDQDQEAEKKDLQNDNLDIDDIPDDSSEKSSASKEANKSNRKRKPDKEKISEVPKKSTKVLQSSEEEPSAISLDNSFQNESQLPENNFSETGDSAASTENLSLQSSPDVSKKNEDILEISSASSTDQTSRRRSNSIPEESPPLRRYNLRSKNCPPKDTEVKSQGFLKDMIITSTPLEIVNEIEVSESREEISGDLELMQSQEDHQNSVENSESQSPECQNNCTIVIADVHANPQPSTPEDSEPAAEENDLPLSCEDDSELAPTQSKMPRFFLEK